MLGAIAGDSDTLARMAGGIAQAFYGGVPDVIAHRAYEILDDHLGQITREFTTVFACP